MEVFRSERLWKLKAYNMLQCSVRTRARALCFADVKKKRTASCTLQRYVCNIMNRYTTVRSVPVLCCMKVCQITAAYTRFDEKILSAHTENSKVQYTVKGQVIGICYYIHIQEQQDTYDSAPGAENSVCVVLTQCLLSALQ